MHTKNANSYLEARRLSSDSLCDSFISRKIMLFDLSVYGHHPAYLRHLISYWCEQALPGHLDIVVSPQFLKYHSDVVELAQEYGDQTVKFVAISTQEEVVLKPRKSGVFRTLRAFQEWYLACRYAQLLKASHCLMMYFDTCQLPLLLGAPFPCGFSGIYFKPTFHYTDFGDDVPSWQERVQHWREKLLLSRVLRRPELKTLFCLDPFVGKYIEKFYQSKKAIPLPDPVQIPNCFDDQGWLLRQQLDITPGRQTFLLFGALDKRKGIQQLLEAVLMLPASLCQKLCLLIVGRVKLTEKALMESQLEAVRRARPVQVVTRDQFIPESEVHAYFQLADVVLAPYQRHIGMSGILQLAAAAQKPVLSSNYGLMGEIVQRHGLGLTVDSTVPDHIAKGLTRFLLEPVSSLCDRNKMQSFSEQNTAEEFAKIIFQYLA
jgi:glycosyltransferase involved in cell wall biosynthesis